MADRYWVGGNNNWDTVSGSLWSATSGGPGGAGVPTASDNVFFDTPGTFVILISGGSGNCLNFRASAGNITFNGTQIINVGGNFDFSGATFNTASTLLRFNLNRESGTCLITSGGNIFVREFVLGTSTSTATFQLQDAFNSTGGTGTVEPFTFNGGTLDLNNKTFTCRRFVCTSAVARTIAFGTSTINCVYGGGGTTSVTFDNRNSTNLSVTGNAVVNITYTGATATSVYSGNLSEANGISFNFTGGTYPLNFLTSALAGITAKNVNFTGFSGTWNVRSVATTIYGSLTLSSGMTFAASTPVMTLGSTSGTSVLTTAGKTFDQPLTINGVGGTVQLAGPLAMAARALVLTNGTLDGAGYTISGTAVIQMITGSVTARNVNTTRAITHTSGTLTLGSGNSLASSTYTHNGGTLILSGNNSIGTYTTTNGTVNLAGYTLTVPSFVISTGTKNLTFNGGTLAVTNATATAFNNAVPANFTTTAGTGVGKISMTGATAKTFVGGGSTYNCTVSNDGAGALTISGNNSIQTVTTTSGNIAITGSNTIATIANTVSPVTYTFTSGTTQTITTSWGLAGASGSLVTLSSSDGLYSYITRTFNTANAYLTDNYLSIKDIWFGPLPADGSAPYVWYFGSTCVNNGNNIGAVFSSDTSIKVYQITTLGAGTWTVPSDWNNLSNNVYLFGAGGGGALAAAGTGAKRGGGGGGGGGFTLIQNYSTSPGSAISVSVGAGGTGGGTTGTTGGSTTWASGAYSANGGLGGSSASAGGQAGGIGGAGSTFNGGKGGNGAGVSTTNTANTAGGGGGGAGGPLGNGAIGGNGGGGQVSSATGGGGGGNGGGSNGATPNGGNNASGVGGATTTGSAGRLGGGGAGGSSAQNGGAGSGGLEIVNSVGSGSGGATGGSTSAFCGSPKAGALFGGGGGGGTAAANLATTAGASGGQGGIIIVYSLGGSNFFIMF